MPDAKPAIATPTLPPWVTYILIGALLGGGGLGATAIGSGVVGTDQVAAELRNHEGQPGHAVELERLRACEEQAKAMADKLDRIERSQLKICAKLGAECQ
jgi:hypothetical protein